MSKIPIVPVHAASELARYAARIVDRGLAAGPGGNISAREGNRIWISPSGYPLDMIEGDDWVPMDIATGRVERSEPRPSSEFEMHLEIYRARPDVNAVVHTHPPITIGVISAGIREIPPMFPDFVAIAGAIGAIDYVVPCSPELAAAVRTEIADPAMSALLMRNHGLLTVGASVREAYYRTEVIEEAARIFWVARSVGTPQVLTPADSAAIL
ncbi:MAG: class II aldolase/adducin family protein, partial [Thermomicrobiales bacterium]|nr:class II aldolase/adducin family protein [Thermomicrobiales bacterium]